ncbi:MAG: protocatechuate 3,4-dioxygenase subunit alpha, partial [bacterium]
IKPGRITGRGGREPMAPHISLWIGARGLNFGLATRLYFEDEAKANAEDPVLRSIEPPGRRQTLIARREMRDGLITYVMDIHLQGENETVFFDV